VRLWGPQTDLSEPRKKDNRRITRAPRPPQVATKKTASQQGRVSPEGEKGNPRGRFLCREGGGNGIKCIWFGGRKKKFEQKTEAGSSVFTKKRMVAGKFFREKRCGTSSGSGQKNGARKETEPPQPAVRGHSNSVRRPPEQNLKETHSGRVTVSD